MRTESVKVGVTEKTALTILRLQNRCMNPKCGSTYALHVHHRFFRSELAIFAKALERLISIYNHCYAPRKMKPWGIHDIQNLVVLCANCHEGSLVGVHGGNERLRNFFKFSFTHPQTGFNIPYYNENAYSNRP